MCREDRIFTAVCVVLVTFATLAIVLSVVYAPTVEEREAHRLKVIRATSSAFPGASVSCRLPDNEGEARCSIYVPGQAPAFAWCDLYGCRR